MRLVDHQPSAVFFFQRDDFGQRCPITEHAVNPLDDDQGVLRPIAEATKTLFEIGRVVVAEADDVGAAHPAAVIDAGMAVAVDQRMSPAPSAWRYAEVGDKSRGKDNGFRTAEELGQFPLKGAMPGERAVGHARTGGSGPFRCGFRGRRLRCTGNRRSGRDSCWFRPGGPRGRRCGLGRGKDLLDLHVERVDPSSSSALRARAIGASFSKSPIIQTSTFLLDLQNKILDRPDPEGRSGERKCRRHPPPPQPAPSP